MGTPLNFLVFCWSIGVRLYLVGESSIGYELPESVFSDELLDVVRHHKPALEYLLGAIEDGTTTREQIYSAYHLENTRRTA
jgi:hypothetical protein